MVRVAPATGDTHAQDVGLCTRYATINSAIPKPYDKCDGHPARRGCTASGVWRTSPERVEPRFERPCQTSYRRTTHESPCYGRVPHEGLAEPPPDDKPAAQAAYDKAWEVCGFDQG